jgi:formate/nitrite transporter
MDTTRRQRLDEASGLPAAAPDGTGSTATLEALDTPHAVPAPAQPLLAAPLSSVAIPTLPLDFVRPADLVADAITASEVKAALPVKDLLIRGFLSGAFLGIATSLAYTVRAQPLAPIAAAVIFPVGFVLLALLGLELATGNFAILPMGVIAKRVSMGGLLRNWSWVYVGNLAGCLFYALFFYWALTSFGHTNGGTVATQFKTAAVAKTVAYQKLGATGWGLAVVKAVLANWMVTVAALMAFVARSTIGKMAAMWLPIMIFFALGFEHSIVNMVVIPVGMMLKAPVSMGQWWWWNQIPVTIGNIIGGAVLTGLALYVTFGEPAKAS